MRENLEWYRRIENPDDARVSVVPGTVSSMRYALVPVSLIEADGPWEAGGAREKLGTLARQVDATHLVITQEDGAAALGEALGQELYVDTLYRIDGSQGACELVEVAP